MSVVIVGGHDRMVSQYKKICKSHNCKAKVFTQMAANLSAQIGKCALSDMDKTRTNIVRCHTSSGTALTEILEEALQAV